MKIIPFLFIATFIPFILIAQKDSSAVTEEPKVFTFVEQMPEFPGGEGGLITFLQKQIKYPEKERDNDIQGRVIIRFVVDENGKVGSVEVMRSVSPGLDNEAVRVVKLMPAFKPGRQEGKAVKVYFTLPIVFKLTDDKNPSTAFDLKMSKDKDFKKGMALQKEGKFDRALKYFKKSVEEYPKDYLGYHYLANCEQTLNNTSAACTHFMKAKELGSVEEDTYIKQNCK